MKVIESSKIYEIVNTIAVKFNPDKIILFGSYASGNPNRDSDLDLLIISSSDLPRHKRAYEIRKSLIGSILPLDIIVYTPEEFENERAIKYSFIYDAIRNSKVLYERS
jgi:uncharacterized protein